MTTLIPTLIPTIMALTESPTKEKWAMMANKYRYGIDIDKAIKNKLVEFIQTVIYIHETQDLIDNNLWTIF